METSTDFLGKLCQDKITKVKGVCTGKITWLYGCDKYILEIERIKDVTPSADWFEGDRLEILENIVPAANIDIQGKQTELLGKLCRDKISDFEGICTGRSVWLYGCDQYHLTPKTIDKNVKPGSGMWLDEGRIEIIGNGITPEEVQSDSGKTGGVFPEHFYPSSERI